MIRYFARVPAAAVFPLFDGHSYAHVNLTVRAGGIFETAEPRMLRADDCKIANGEAWIYIGSMSDLIAQRVNLPFGVSFTED